ncbi:MAG TPA: helix-turn-helix domain-containing protein [Candidatus Baltobacteraceae bacterium]|nr:helix-turn-helix domain-containing protein [Candidatus Baltobacteraceae bacterium]
MSPRTLDRFISIAEAAGYLGVSERTVRNMMYDGRLTAHRLGDRIVRIRLSDTAPLEPWA